MLSRGTKPRACTRAYGASALFRRESPTSHKCSAHDRVVLRKPARTLLATLGLERRRELLESSARLPARLMRPIVEASCSGHLEEVREVLDKLLESDLPADTRQLLRAQRAARKRSSAEWSELIQAVQGR